MRFNVIALSAATALVWGMGILIVASANLVWPPYGQAFLDLLASIYPGYHPAPTIGSIVSGTLYGVVDGAGGGALFGWLYNRLARQ